MSLKLKDEGLDPTQKVEIQHSLKNYLRICQSNQEGFKLTSSVRNSVVTIRGALDPETVQNLKTLSNGEEELFKQLKDESSALLLLMRKQHRQGQFMSTIQKEYQKAEVMIKNGLGALFRDLRKEDIIQNIASQLNLIKACSCILNLNSRRSLKKKEKEQFSQALRLLHEAQKQQEPSSSEIAEVDTLEKLRQTYGEFLNALSELKKIMKSFDEALDAAELKQTGARGSSSLVMEGFFKPNPLKFRMPEDRTLADPYGAGAIVAYKPYILRP